MRSLLLFSMLLVLAAGCGDAGVAEKDSSSSATGIHLDQVDAVGLESVLAANGMTLIDFTAEW